jgi:hypothetical protein
MAVVEDFADAATCPFGDFACALRGADADIFSGYSCAFANVFRGSGGVEGDEIAGAFADTLGCRSGSLAGAFADVAGSAADVAAGAAGLGLVLVLRGSLRRGRWVLRVLSANVLRGEDEGQCKEREGRWVECLAHG